MAIAYWGRKSQRYMQQILKLYPLDEIDTVVDACMGSGSFSENISCQMIGVNRIGIELDRGVYVLHKVIRNQYEKLLEMILEYNYSEASYGVCRKKIRDYNQGKDEIDEVEIAFAELVILFFSYNSMRGNTPRRFDSFQKYNGERRNMLERKLKSVHDRFFLKAPGDIASLHLKWQQLQLIYGNFMEYEYLWKNPKVWIFIDTPYELCKRGIDEYETTKKNGLGYDCDMRSCDHDKFISRLEQLYKINELKAKMIICTNYDADELGNMIIPADDRYSRLLELGFIRKAIENRPCSNIYYSTEDKNKGMCKKRHRKIEVVYINYCTCM